MISSLSHVIHVTAKSNASIYQSCSNCALHLNFASFPLRMMKLSGRRGYRNSQMRNACRNVTLALSFPKSSTLQKYCVIKGAKKDPGTKELDSATFFLVKVECLKMKLILNSTVSHHLPAREGHVIGDKKGRVNGQ